MGGPIADIAETLMNLRFIYRKKSDKKWEKIHWSHKKPKTMTVYKEKKDKLKNDKKEVIKRKKKYIDRIKNKNNDNT